MKRVWMIRHPSDETYLGSFVPGAERWIDDDRDAMRFADERTAALVNTVLLEGKGVAVEVIDATVAA